MARKYEADVNIDSSHHIFGFFLLVMSVLFMLYSLHVANVGSDPLGILRVDLHTTQHTIQQMGHSMFKVAWGAIVFSILTWTISCTR